MGNRIGTHAAIKLVRGLQRLTNYNLEFFDSADPKVVNEVVEKLIRKTLTTKFF